MQLRRPHLVIALAVIVVGASTVAFLVALRSGDTGSTRTASKSDAPTRAAERVDFAPRSERDAVLRRISASIQNSAAGLLDAPSALRIAEMSAERIAFMAEPDLEQWRAMVRTRGGDPVIPEGMDEATYLTRWRGHTARFAGSRLSDQGISVQRGIDGEEHTLGGPGSMYLRGDDTVSAIYPEPSNGAELIDVLVPIQYKLDNGDRIPCTLSFRYTRRDRNGPWMFSNVFAYFGPEAFGHGLNLPLK